MAADIQYVSDLAGNTVSVLVPIEVWRDIEAERETAYVLSTEAMRRRLADARSRDTGIPFEEALKMLGLTEALDA